MQSRLVLYLASLNRLKDTCFDIEFLPLKSRALKLNLRNVRARLVNRTYSRRGFGKVYLFMLIFV